MDLFASLKRPAKGKRSSKRSSHSNSWSERQYDEKLGYYRTRVTSRGQTVAQYERPETQEDMPRPDSVLHSTTREAASRVDYPIQTTPANYTTYTPANTDSYTSSYTPAEAGYGRRSAYESPTPDTLQLQNLRISESSALNVSNAYSSSAIQTSDPQLGNPPSQDRFVVINDGPKFFKVGRVFKVMWAEPAGNHAKNDSFVTPSSKGQQIYSKVRHFVVVRERRGCCSCAPLNTYDKQGINKRGIVASDHAAVYDSRSSKPRKDPRTKDPFPIIIEALGEQIHEMSFINFGKVHTVEHDFAVMKIGRIPKEDVPRLKEYFLECFLSETRSSPSSPTEENDKPPSIATLSPPPQQSTTYYGQTYNQPTDGYGAVSNYTTTGAAGYPSGSSYYQPPPASYVASSQCFTAINGASSTSDQLQPQTIAQGTGYGSGYPSPAYPTQTTPYASQASTYPASNYSSQTTYARSPYHTQPYTTNPYLPPSNYGDQAPVDNISQASPSYQTTYSTQYGTYPAISNYGASTSEDRDVDEDIPLPPVERRRHESYAGPRDRDRRRGY